MLDWVSLRHLHSCCDQPAGGRFDDEERTPLQLIENEPAAQPEAIAAARAELLPAAAQHHAERILESVCDPSRLRIVQALRATPLTVGELSRVIAKTRAATSQHLKVLRDADAVRAERRGQFVVYSLSQHVNAEILENVASAFDQLRPSA